MKTPLFIFSSLLLTALPLAAQTHSPTGAGKAGAKTTPPTGLSGPDMFKTADTNADGFISREEFQRHRASHSGSSQSPTGTADVGTVSAISFEALDTNGDGKLSPQEFAQVASSEWRSSKIKHDSATGNGAVIKGAR